MGDMIINIMQLQLLFFRELLFYLIKYTSPLDNEKNKISFIDTKNKSRLKI